MTVVLAAGSLPALSERQAKAAAVLAQRGLLEIREGMGPSWDLPEWGPQPVQAKFLASTAGECLFGGAAGGGKSDGALNYSIRRRRRYSGSRGLIVRRTLAELKKGGALIDRSHELLSGIATYRTTEHRWLFPDGGSIEFGYCEREADVYRYQGSQYDDIVFEEAGQLTPFQLKYLLSRCRTTRPGLVTQVRFTANPGGVGHSYLKSRFVDPAPWGEVWTPAATDEEPKPRSRCFIPARLADNRILEDADPNYRAFLESLPEVERLALLEGRWDVFVGQFFSEWSPAVHVCEPFEIPAWWPRIASLDWGYNHPAVFLWAAVGPGNVVYVYRELALRRLQPADLAERFLEFEDSALCSVAAGPDTFSLARASLGGPSIAEELSRCGLALTNPTQGRKRHHQWQQVRRFLAPVDESSLGDGHYPAGLPPARLQILRGAAPRLVEQIPSMIYSDTDPEDLLKTDIDESGQGGDDAVDSLAYLLMSRPWEGSPPPSTRGGYLRQRFDEEERRRRLRQRR